MIKVVVLVGHRDFRGHLGGTALTLHRCPGHLGVELFLGLAHELQVGRIFVSSLSKHAGVVSKEHAVDATGPRLELLTEPNGELPGCSAIHRTSDTQVKITSEQS